MSSSQHAASDCRLVVPISARWDPGGCDFGSFASQAQSDIGSRRKPEPLQECIFVAGDYISKFSQLTRPTSKTTCCRSAWTLQRCDAAHGCGCHSSLWGNIMESIDDTKLSKVGAAQHPCRQSPPRPLRPCCGTVLMGYMVESFENTIILFLMQTKKRSDVYPVFSKIKCR